MSTGAAEFVLSQRGPDPARAEPTSAEPHDQGPTRDIARLRPGPPKPCGCSEKYIESIQD
jgi:hypothetical protein